MLEDYGHHGNCKPFNELKESWAACKITYDQKQTYKLLAQEFGSISNFLRTCVADYILLNGKEMQVLDKLTQKQVDRRHMHHMKHPPRFLKVLYEKVENM